MDFTQLDMFGYFAQTPTTAVAPQPAKDFTLSSTATGFKVDLAPHMIETPSWMPKGFKTVAANGITTKANRTNPCSVCSKGSKDKGTCSEHCRLFAARQAYLQEIGIGLVSGVDSRTGAYEFGN